MNARSMIVVAGGSSHRFGSDKLMVEVNGRPLIAHTLATIGPLVDECTLVIREDQVDKLSGLDAGVNVVVGGSTRTQSEIAGLMAASPSALIGIHDGARPVPAQPMMERLFDAAAEFGGAVPGLPTRGIFVDRRDLGRLGGVVRVQTPQVFWGPELRAAYLAAAKQGFEGQDTAEVAHNFTNLEIVMVEGDPANIKVTYPEDLQLVLDRLGGG